jgi:uncharacterized protein (TIGR00255 family)
MAVVSMTGFGRGESRAEGWSAEVEIGAVNRKQFDARVSMPRPLQALEADLVARARKRISRGHLSVTVRTAPDARSTGSGFMDAEGMRRLIAEIRSLAQELNLPDDLSAASLVALRDVARRAEPDMDPARVRPCVERALDAALDALGGMKASEGRALHKSLSAHLRSLRSLVRKIRARAPRIVVRYRSALRKRIEAAMVAPGGALDPALAREVAIFAERCDISEEMDRLDSHFAQWESFADSDQACGRSLDFLCQEIFREINTVGSKANDALVAKLVVEAKTALERMREQVQNVE